MTICKTVLKYAMLFCSSVILLHSCSYDLEKKCLHTFYKYDFELPFFFFFEKKRTFWNFRTLKERNLCSN